MMQNTPFPKTILPALKRAYILSGFLAVVGLAFLCLKAPSFVKNRAIIALEQNLAPSGIGNIEIDSLNFGWGRLYLHGIRSRPAASQPSLTVQEIDVAFSPLLTIKAIDIVGATLTLAKPEKQVFGFKGWQEKAARYKTLLHAGKTPNLPDIAIRDALVVIPASHQTLKVPVHAMTEQTVAKNRVFTLDWGDNTGKENFCGQVILDFGQENVTVDAYITNINFQTPHFKIAAPEISFWVNLPQEESEGCQIEGFALLDDLSLERYGTLKIPLEVNLEAEGTFEELFIDDLTVIGKGRQSPALQVEGSVKPLQMSANLATELQVPDLSGLWDFTPLLAAYKGQKVSLKGQVDVAGNLIWNSRQLTAPDLIMNFRDVRFMRGNFSLEGLTSQISFRSLVPLSIRGLQSIKSSALSTGAGKLTNALLEFSCNDEGRLQIRQLSAHALGGTLKAHNFQSAKNSPVACQFDLDVKDIELGDILRLTDMQSLSGQGKLAGSASLSYDPGEGLELLNAELHSATESGLIRYRPQLDPTAGSGPSRQESNMAFQVLSNLHFTLLSIRLIQDPRQRSELQGIVKLLGSNPEVLNGYPFEFNIVTTGALKDLAVNTLKHLQPSHNLKDYKKHVKAPNTEPKLKQEG